MVQEVDADQLETLCKKQLLIGSKDLELARKIIIQNGFSNPVSQNGIMHLDDLEAIEHPEDIATIMVNAGCPPNMLKVDEENLESYFLRTIEMNGGVK